MHRNHFSCILLTISMFFLLSPYVFAGWETGAKVGYDSNIDRAVEDGMSDTFMTGFLSFTREPAKDTGTDWSLNLGLEGARYADSNFLNYGMASITPSIIFYPHARWRIDISSFAQAIAVKDEEQSSVAFGGEISMKQLWGHRFYTGEYFIYTDSRADVEIFSYRDKAVGLYAGVNWTDAFWSEIGYELSRGDSFRAVEEIITTEIVASQIYISQAGTGGQGGSGQGGSGQYGTGNSPRYSEAYNEYIINEQVDRQIIGINMGYQFTRHIFSFINYAYVSYSGYSGDSESHTGVIGIGYSF